MAKSSSPWSVKGINEETRTIARSEAQTAGMTIGHWVDHAILATALQNVGAIAGRQTPPSDHATGQAVASSPALIDVSAQIAASEQKIEAAIHPLLASMHSLTERLLRLEEKAPPAALATAAAASPDTTVAPAGRPRPSAKIPGNQPLPAVDKPWSWQLPLHPQLKRTAGFHWTTRSRVRWLKPKPAALPVAPQGLAPPAIAPIGDLGPVNINIDVGHHRSRPRPPTADLAPSIIIVEKPPIVKTRLKQGGFVQGVVTEPVEILQPLPASNRRRRWPIVVSLLLMLVMLAAAVSYARPQQVRAVWQLMTDQATALWGPVKQQSMAFLADNLSIGSPPEGGPAGQSGGQSAGQSEVREQQPTEPQTQTAAPAPSQVMPKEPATDPSAATGQTVAARPQPAPATTAPPAPQLTSPAAEDVAAPTSGISLTTLRQQARAGAPQAQSQLGLHFLRGDGVARDPKLAAQWLREAAIQGVASAQYNLGVLYSQGIGVSANSVRAQLWFLSAAEQGLVAAMYNLGLVYVLGGETPQNYPAAISWFEKAAAGGIWQAHANLAQIYAQGLTGTADLARAQEYAQNAAELGGPAAGQQIAKREFEPLLSIDMSAQN